MVDFLKRKLLSVTGNYIVVNLDKQKKISVEYHDYFKISDLL